MKKNYFIIIACCLLNFVSSAQNKSIDTLRYMPSDLKFKTSALIIPTALIGFGVVGLESHTIKDLNSSTNSEITEHIDQKFTIDDISQYAPFVSVYALNAANIIGKHNFRDRTLILGTAYLLMGATVNILKATSKETRPDKSGNNSFPSGHTATAFMGAEFLFQEYKDQSIWYGITGYAIAAGTGYFRMYNNRHWLTDIAAGAGIGILSTKVAYWTHPYLRKLLFKKQEKSFSGIILPTYSENKLGVGMAFTF